MSTDIRASENGLWCPRHSSLFSSGVKFWQPSELGTFARRPRKVFFFGKRKKKKMDEERAKFSKFGAGLLFETRKKNTSFALTLNMLICWQLLFTKTMRSDDSYIWYLFAWCILHSFPHPASCKTKTLLVGNLMRITEYKSFGVWFGNLDPWN